MRHRSATLIVLLLVTSGVARAEGTDQAATDQASTRPAAMGPAAEKDTGVLGFFAGAVTFVTGFGVGAVLMTTGGENSPARDRAGWLTIESAFVLAPIAAHGVTSEWTRGLAFAAAPALAEGGSAAVFALEPRAVRHAPLPGQRVLWGLFGAAMFVSAAGVVDAAFADDRASSFVVAPSVGSHQVGLEIGGTL